MKKEIHNVDEYIHSFPEEARHKLQSLRKLIINECAEVRESISYGMPAYKLNNRPLIYFGCFTKHIGLYATPSGHQKFKERLSKYKHGKGSVQFPLDEELPMELIAEIVAFRIKELQSAHK